MVKRRRSVSWGAALQRSVAKLTRSALRSGTKALVRAAPPAARKIVPKLARIAKATGPAEVAKAAAKRASTSRPARSGAENWKLGVALAGGVARRYRVYRPPGLSSTDRVPLLVMLHGCTQDAIGLAASTRMNRLAARDDFLVLYVEQDRLAHAQGCWNWYETRSGRAQLEAAAIVAAVDQVVASHPVDAQRVAIAGMSAGAGMAALVAMHHPERFRAVAMHSGIAPGAANSSATALSAMLGRRRPALSVADGVALPPLLVIHGAIDNVVRVGNGRDAARVWADALEATAASSRTVQRGKRYPTSVTDFKRGGRVLVSLCEVSGLGHAWSGGAAAQAYSDAKGPDASRMIWSFLEREFRRASATSTASHATERTSNR